MTSTPTNRRLSKQKSDNGYPSPTNRHSWYEESNTYGHFVKSQEHLLKQTEANPQPTLMPPPTAGLSGAIGERHVISFIGLPARGKPFMVERLCRYLSFFHGARCRIFDIAGPEWEDDVTIFKGLKDFLEEEDEIAAVQVMAAIDGCEDEEVVKKNVDSGRIAIVYSHDEMKTSQKRWSGSSKERRWAMHDQLKAELEVACKLLFIEVIVTDPELVHELLVARECADSEHDATVNAQVQKIKADIKAYTRIFVTIQEDGSEDDLSYMKMINYGSRIITNRMRGFLCMRIVQYLSHLHPRPHTIYLSRHGQSEYNKLQKIGGNPGLTEDGEAYARWLGEWVPENICGASSDDHSKQQPCRLWTSSMKRTIETARHIPHPIIKTEDGQDWQQMSLRVYRNLDEIFAGEYEGMTYEEIERTSGDEAILRKKDKLGYRYPRGESYYDLIARLDALTLDLESYCEPLLVVSHQATLRMLYAYLKGIDRKDAPKLDIPLHTVIKIQYDGYCRHHYGDDPDSLDYNIIETRFSFKPNDRKVGEDGQAHL